MKTFSKAPGSDEQQIEVRCVICGADAAVKHWDCDGYAFVRCRVCGHIYQNPRPAANDLIARYDEEYRDYEIENDRNFLDLMLKGLSDVRFFERLQRAHVAPSLLDIGCATGTLLEYAAGLGISVQGIEVCEPAARFGIEHRGVPIGIGTLDTVTLPSGSYSAIHFSHVIEHVPDPRAFLLTVRSLLAPAGLGVLVTPNSAGLQARLFGDRWRSAIADHVHLFSASNLRRLLRECGFQVVASKTWGGLGLGTAPRWLKRPADRLAKLFGFGDVVLLLFTPADSGAKQVLQGDS